MILTWLACLLCIALGNQTNRLTKDLQMQIDANHDTNVHEKLKRELGEVVSFRINHWLVLKKHCIVCTDDLMLRNEICMQLILYSKNAIICSSKQVLRLEHGSVSA